MGDAGPKNDAGVKGDQTNKTNPDKSAGVVKEKWEKKYIQDSVSPKKTADKQTNFEKMKADAQRKAEFDAVTPYDLAGPPPSIDNLDKFIPFDAPVEKKPGPSAEAIHTRKDKGLREIVANPKDGVGCHFNGLPTEKEMERWWGGLSTNEKNNIRTPDTIVTIRAYASREGKTGYNQELSEKRAQFVKQWLVNNCNVDPSLIEVVAYGEKAAQQMGKPDNQDDPNDRVVLIDILGATQSGENKTPGIDEAQKSGANIVDKVGNMPSPPPKYTIGEGVSKLPFDVAFKILLELLNVEILGAVKTLAQYAFKLSEAIGQSHDNNVQAARVNGLTNGVSILWADQKFPNNPHIQDGKPYSKSDFYHRALKLSYSQGLPSMAFGKVEAIGGADLAFKQSTDALVDTVNTFLQKGRNPKERQEILRSFVEAAEKEIKEIKIMAPREAKKPDILIN